MLKLFQLGEKKMMDFKARVDAEKLHKILQSFKGQQVTVKTNMQSIGIIGESCAVYLPATVNTPATFTVSPDWATSVLGMNRAHGEAVIALEDDLLTVYCGSSSVSATRSNGSRVDYCAVLNKCELYNMVDRMFGNEVVRDGGAIELTLGPKTLTLQQGHHRKRILVQNNTKDTIHRSVRFNSLYSLIRVLQREEAILNDFCMITFTTDNVIISTINQTFLFD